MMAGVVFLAVSCSEGPQKPPEVRPVSEVSPIESRFPELSPISRTIWVENALGVQNARVPGPTDFVIEGFAWPSSGAVAKLRLLSDWSPSNAPAPPRQLEGQSSETHWLHSEKADKLLTGGRGTGRFYLAQSSDLIYFSAVNAPVRSPAASGSASG
jgi:hypothetical protein